MGSLKRRSARARAIALCAVISFAPAFGQGHPSAAQPTETLRDGQHNCDFEFGTWKTHLSRLLRPLTGSHTGVEYEGTTFVRKVWNGRANLAELEADSPAGHLEI